MFREDREEELRRLEEELLAQEEMESDEEEYDEEEYDEECDEEAEYEETAPMRQSGRSCKVYNADRTDVDLDTYSEAVFSGSRKPVLPWIFGALTAVLILLLYLYLKQRGYL